MIKCATQKKVYLTQEFAEEALVGAHMAFHYAVGQGPIAVYACVDCGYFHLTSKGAMNDKLKHQLQNGSVGRQKVANDWLAKLKVKRS